MSIDDAPYPGRHPTTWMRSRTHGSGRRSIRLRGLDYRGFGPYFVTICTQDRECLFGAVLDGGMHLNVIGRSVITAWERLPARFQFLRHDERIVMPNHLHGILVFLPCETPVPLGQVVRAFKSLSTIEVNRVTGRTGPLWQRGYYEHVIDAGEDLDRIRGYIRANPEAWPRDPIHRVGARDERARRQAAWAV